MKEDQDSTSIGSGLGAGVEVVLEGWMLKLSRNKLWQDRYFVLNSEQILTYAHGKEYVSPNQYFRISRESGCEISDVYVERRQKGSNKGPLYCIDLSWSDDSSTAVNSLENYVTSNMKFQEFDRDEISSAGAPLPQSPKEPTTPEEKKSMKLTPKRLYKRKSMPMNTTQENRTGSPTENLKSFGDKFKSLSFDEMDFEKEAGSAGSTGAPVENIPFIDWLTGKKERKNSGDELGGTMSDQKRRKGRNSGEVPYIVDMKLDQVNLRSESGLSFDERETVGRGVVTDEEGSIQKRGESAFEIKYSNEIEEFGMLHPQKTWGEMGPKKNMTRSTKIAMSAGIIAGLGVILARIGIDDNTIVPVVLIKAGTIAGVVAVLVCWLTGKGENRAQLLKEHKKKEYRGDISKLGPAKPHSKKILPLEGRDSPSVDKTENDWENARKTGKAALDAKFFTEKEERNAVYSGTKRKERRSKKKMLESTKIAVAAGAMAGAGVLTAGIGLAASLVVLGAVAVAGGTAGVAEAGLKRKWTKSGKLTIATTNFEQAKKWKSSLEACLEFASIKDSTWGQMFVADGRKTTSALVPNDLDFKTAHSRESQDDIDFDDLDNSFEDFDMPKGQSQLFLRDRNFFGDSGSRWRPVECAWTSFLGPSPQNLRIFREEKILSEQKSRRVARLAVGETCAPLKTQIVLKAQPLDAFMCLMLFSRMPRPLADGKLSPNSGQSASFRLLEKIDDHTDIVHLVFRKLYLFPFWTEPRDFVLFRYWRYEEDGSYVVCYDSMTHPSCPQVPGFVRGEMHQVYTIAPPKDLFKRRKTSSSRIFSECLLTSVVQVDPKGWLPRRPLPLLSNQTYADAFGVAALLQMLDVRDAIESDRFVDTSLDIQQSIPAPTKLNGLTRDQSRSSNNDLVNYDLRYANRERCDPVTSGTLSGLESRPPPLDIEKWAEPDANSFLVRGPSYKDDRVKINAGASIGRLVAVDVVQVDKPIFSGMSTHPSERIQLGLQREKRQKELGKASDMPPFMFVVNIILPGPPFYHGVFYYAIDDMSTIDGSDGTGSSNLCNKFIFGQSDDFRDKTFKLIPQIVEGNFIVRKAVGSTPAIMGTKLQQNYVRHKRYMEVILNCGSSAVATGVIRLSLGYAKTLMIDMGFLLEGDSEDVLPERIFGCVRMKYPDFGTHLREVKQPEKDVS